MQKTLKRNECLEINIGKDYLGFGDKTIEMQKDNFKELSSADLLNSNNMEGKLTLKNKILTLHDSMTLKSEPFENIMGKKEMLVTIIFFFSDHVSYPSQTKF